MIVVVRGKDGKKNCVATLTPCRVCTKAKGWRGCIAAPKILAAFDSAHTQTQHNMAQQFLRNTLNNLPQGAPAGSSKIATALAGLGLFTFAAFQTSYSVPGGYVNLACHKGRARMWKPNLMAQSIISIVPIR
jgi:hypothetical protein